jgi:hypothetical protein
MPEKAGQTLHVSSTAAVYGHRRSRKAVSGITGYLLFVRLEPQYILHIVKTRVLSYEPASSTHSTPGK